MSTNSCWGSKWLSRSRLKCKCTTNHRSSSHTRMPQIREGLQLNNLSNKTPGISNNTKTLLLPNSNLLTITSSSPSAADKSLKLKSNNLNRCLNNSFRNSNFNSSSSSKLPNHRSQRARVRDRPINHSNRTAMLLLSLYVKSLKVLIALLCLLMASSTANSKETRLNRKMKTISLDLNLKVILVERHLYWILMKL